MSLFFPRPLSFSTPQDTSAAALAKIFSLLRLTLILSLFLLAFWLLGDGLAVIFASLLFAIILHRLALLLQKPCRFLPHSLAVGIVALGFIVAFAALFWANGAAMGQQFLHLKTTLDAQTGELKNLLSRNFLGQQILEYLPASLNGDGAVGHLSRWSFGLATGVVSTAVGLITTLIVVFIAAFYFALCPRLYIEGLLRIMPPAHREEMGRLLKTAGNTLWLWTAGQAVDMLVVGVCTGVGLDLLGVPMAFALGIVAGICNFVPYVGAILGAVPALLVTLSMSGRETLLVALLYAIIQFCEGNIISPFIQERAVSMPPGIAILAQTVFGALLGLPGLILASPLTAALLAVGNQALPPLEKHYSPEAGENISGPEPS